MGPYSIAVQSQVDPDVTIVMTGLSRQYYCRTLDGAIKDARRWAASDHKARRMFRELDETPFTLGNGTHLEFRCKECGTLKGHEHVDHCLTRRFGWSAVWYPNPLQQPEGEQLFLQELRAHIERLGKIEALANALYWPELSPRTA